MSQFLYKLFLKKTNLDSVIKVGGETEDPYFETIPEQELHFYQRKGAKRRRKLPGFIAKNDLKVLQSVKRKAYRLDLQLSFCGIRLGWAGIIGIIPWIGDLIAMYFVYQLVRKADQIEGGLPTSLRSKMMSNVAFDFVVGLIPFLGNFMNIMYKCNSRNFVLLEKHLVEKYSKQAAVPSHVPGGNESHGKRGIDTENTQEHSGSTKNPFDTHQKTAPQQQTGYYDDAGRMV